eukprot:COSAG01_NODE_2942_length_6815_cov_103.694312_1_plen_225_part_00
MKLSVRISGRNLHSYFRQEVRPAHIPRIARGARRRRSGSSAAAASMVQQTALTAVLCLSWAATAAAAATTAAAAAAAVPSVEIAPGVRLPFVALGTGSGQKGDVERATQLWLGQGGGVAIDTAFDYGDEAAIAKGLAAAGLPRSRVFLETKVPCTSYALAKSHLESNLQSLAVGRVDLVLSHHSGDASSPCDPGGSLAEVSAATPRLLPHWLALPAAILNTESL